VSVFLRTAGIRWNSGRTVAPGLIFEVSVIAEPDSLSIQLENSRPLPVKLTVD